MEHDETEHKEREHLHRHLCVVPHRRYQFLPVLGDQVQRLGRHRGLLAHDLPRTRWRVRSDPHALRKRRRVNGRETALSSTVHFFYGEEERARGRMGGNKLFKYIENIK